MIAAKELHSSDQMSDFFCLEGLKKRERCPKCVELRGEHVKQQKLCMALGQSFLGRTHTFQHLLVIYPYFLPDSLICFLYLFVYNCTIHLHLTLLYCMQVYMYVCT